MHRCASLAPSIGSGSASAWSNDVKKIRKRQANACREASKREGDRMREKILEKTERKENQSGFWINLGLTGRGKGDMPEGDHKKRGLAR